MDCYACEQPAINACKRCTSTYCEDHGNAQYCNECLKPDSALPSLNLYRGALLAMLIGTAVAVYLLLRPPGETESAPPVVVGRTTPTATARAGSEDPTVAPRTPQVTRTPAGTPTAAAPTESPFGEHIVAEGDTLFSIAEANLPPGDDLAAYVTAIATLNGISEDAILDVGDTIVLPPLPD